MPLMLTLSKPVHLGDQRVQVDRLGPGPGSAAESEQFAGKMDGPIRGAMDLGENPPQIGIRTLADVLSHLGIARR